MTLDLTDATASDRALFHPLGPADPARHDRLAIAVEATAYGRGPWDHALLHGGPIVGLAAWAAERVGPGPQGLECARLTVELFRGIPATRLEVEATVAKPGRRSRVVDVAIRIGSEIVARSSSQWLAPSPGWDSDEAPPPPRPTTVASPDDGEFDYPRPGFNCDTAELRYVSGSNETSGPGVIWTRLTSPLMAGETPTPFVTVSTIADLAAAAGYEYGPAGEAFINADLTLQLQRYPTGPWIALDAKNHRSAGSGGYNEAAVHDDQGTVGRILQSLVETPAPPGG